MTPIEKLILLGIVGMSVFILGFIMVRVLGGT